MNPLSPHREVRVGAVAFGNHLPLALIAGPCQLESRDHAFDMAGALKEMAEKLKIGLIYKSSYDKANRTSGKGARGVGMEKALADLRRPARQARPAGADRRA